MEHYVEIDVSLERSSVCVVDVGGKIVAEAKIESHPDAIINFLRKLGLSIERIGLEAGPLSQWLHVGLTKGSFETVLLETRHVKAALSAMTVKTDRRDARGIAQLLRMGWFRPVHCKSPGSQEVRALLVARKQLLGKLLDVEFSIRGILRGFGLKMGMVTRTGFEGRVRELCAGQAMLEQIAEAMLAARAALRKEYSKLHKAYVGARAAGRDLPPADERAGRGTTRGDHLQDGDRRSGTHPKIQSRWRVVGADAAKISIRIDGRDGPRLLRRRHDGPHRAL